MGTNFVNNAVSLCLIARGAKLRAGVGSVMMAILLMRILINVWGVLMIIVLVLWQKVRHSCVIALLNLILFPYSGSRVLNSKF